MLSLTELAELIARDNEAKGLTLEKVGMAGAVNWLHEEISEIYKAYCKAQPLDEELADLIITALDICGKLEINIQAAVMEKIAKNRERPLGHGRVRF